MSHYCCAVFAKSPDDFYALLEPYNECDKKYYVFQPITEEELKDRFEKFCIENKNWTFDSYVKNFNYVYENDQWGYWSNPNGYWDWYTIDGKDYLFELKSRHHYTNSGWLRKHSVDFFKVDEESGREAASFWEEYVEGKDPDAKAYYTREYYLERFKTKENYIKYAARTVPYSFITPDGEWHSPGTMGWFACDDSTAESWDAYVKEFDDFVLNAPDCYVTFADLHI